MIDCIDKKFKDAAPADTLGKIYGILNELGITASEMWNESGLSNCYSVRVTINGTGIGSNGKGISKELAAASGYAELMERIQSGMHGIRGELDFSIGKGEPTYADSVFLSETELSEKCGFYLDALSKAASKSENVPITSEKLAQICFQLEKGAETTEAVTFYDAVNGKKVLLPLRLNCLTSGSNGLAAGNTMEEAIVEGFSEIVERFAQNRILKERLVPPTIPEEYLKNFETAYKIITDIRNAGYDILIKDCSLGEGYPVVAAVIIDKKLHTYHAHVGSSPVFEIALQRSLTEMFQGRQIGTVAKVHEISLDSARKVSAKNVMDAFHLGIGQYPIEYFDDQPSYPFVPFESKKDSTNKQLLAEIIKYVEDRGYRLLVRDLSIFGFHTYRVVVPGMSEWKYHYFSSSVPALKLSVDTYGEMNNLKKASPDKLFGMQILNRYRVKAKIKDTAFSSLTEMPIGASPEEDLLLGNVSLAYVEWECGDRALACKYAKSVKPYMNEQDKALVSCLCKLPDLYNKKSIALSLTQLSRFYEASVIEDLRNVLMNDGNPFTRFTLECSPENCGGCRYKDTCEVQMVKELHDMIHSANMAFDNESALDKMHENFTGVRSLIE